MKLRGTVLVMMIFGGVFAFVVAKKGGNESEETNAGKELVMESIEAHGGIEKWRANGDLKFRWKYHMTDRGATVDTLQIVDPVSFEAKHMVGDSEVSFGRYDGKYWIFPVDAEFMPPVQFWTLTPIYFMGIPFVFDDDQIDFDLLPESKTFDGKDYIQVKLHYDDAAGDSPDDYYVLLIDPESKLVRGAYYTVTNPLVYKGGPIVEKFISLDNLKDVNGLLLSGGHKTYSMKDGVIGGQMRFTEVSEVEFVRQEDVDFKPPVGAKILPSVSEAK